MIEVELPDGTVVEFPDGTPDADIQRALSSVQAPAVQTHGFGGREPTTAPQADPIVSEARDRLGAMSPLRQKLFGGEQAFRSIGTGIKQLTVGLSPEEERDVLVRRAMEREAGGTSALSRFLGDAAIAAGPSAGVAALASRLPRARAAANVVGQGAVGAGLASLQPVVGDEDRASNATAGFMFGAGGQVAGNTVARAIQGPVRMAREALRQSPAVRRAASLGQLADKDTTTGRIAAGLEERFRSLPIVGQLADRKREAGVSAWRDDVIRRGTPEGYTPTGENTHQRLDDIYQEFQDRYGNALRGTDVGRSPIFESARDNALNSPRRGIPHNRIDEIEQTVNNYYNDLFNPTTGRATGEQAKKFEAFLSQRARAFQRAAGQPNGDPYAADVARIYEDLERAWSTASRRQLGSGVRQQLAPLDQRYAPFKTVERAAAFTGNTGGDFSPAQLNTAVANRTPRSSFGRGRGILQQEATEGKKLFMDRLPNTGSADRALGGMLALGAVEPTGTAAAAALAGTALTTNPGKNLMLGETRAQQLLRLLRADTAARRAAAPLSMGYMNQEE